MVFYNEKEQLYLETNALGASLLQVRDSIWFLRNEAPNSAALLPMEFVSKSKHVHKPTTAI